jgi:hypothetical protein
MAVARHGPLVWLCAAGLLLIVSEFLVLREIRAITAVPAGGTTRGGAHHGYALALIGAAMLPFSVGATRGGSQPAAVALLALSLAAAAIVLVADLPQLHDTGLIGRTYELARARPKAGFWVETVGTAMALTGSIGVLLRRRRRVL